MPVTVEWGNEAQTLVIMRLTEPFSMEAVADGVDQINALMDTVSHRVTPAVDFRAVHGLPRGALASYQRVASRMGHPNSTGWLIMIGVRRFMKPLLDIFSRVFRTIEYADTLEDAVALAERARLQPDT